MTLNEWSDTYGIGYPISTTPEGCIGVVISPNHEGFAALSSLSDYQVVGTSGGAYRLSPRFSASRTLQNVAVALATVTDNLGNVNDNTPHTLKQVTAGNPGHSAFRFDTSVVVNGVKYNVRVTDY